MGGTILLTLTGIYGFHLSVEINMQNMVRQQKGKPPKNINYLYKHCIGVNLNPRKLIMHTSSLERML